MKEQIENQNKESHRPYIRILDIRDILNDLNVDKSFYFASHQFKVKNDMLDNHSFYTNRSLELDKKNEDNVKIEIIINNCGYGIAHNIHFVGLKDTYYSSIRFGQKSGNYFSILDIAQAETININFNISCYLEFNDASHKYEDGITFLLFYSDLYENVFSSYIYVHFIADKEEKPRTLDVQYTIFTQGSRKFNNVLSNLKVDYKEEIRKYKNQLLAKGETR